MLHLPPHLDPIPRALNSIYPLIAIARDGSWHPLGTAFIVGRVDGHHAFLMTAAHVAEQIHRIDRRSWERPLPRLPGINDVPFSRQRELDGTRLAVVNLSTHFPAFAYHMQAWGLNEQDITILDMMIPPESPPWFSAPLPIDPSPVTVGVELQAIGFTRMMVRDIESQVVGPNDGIDFKVDVIRRTGRVRRRLDVGESINRWPGYYVDCAFDSGMSGGPLLEFRMHDMVIRGVIGADESLPEDPSRGAGTAAFASEVWPSLAVPMMMGMSVGTPGIIPRFVDMFALPFVDDRADSLRHLEIEGRGPRQKVVWRPTFSEEDLANGKGPNIDPTFRTNRALDLGWIGRWRYPQ